MVEIIIEQKDIFKWGPLFDKHLKNTSENTAKCGINSAENVCKLGNGFFGDVFRFKPLECNQPEIVIKKTKNYTNNLKSKSILINNIEEQLINKLTNTKQKLSQLIRIKLKNKGTFSEKVSDMDNETKLKREASIVLKLNNNEDPRRIHILKGYGITEDENKHVYFFSKYYKYTSIDRFWYEGGMTDTTNNNKRKLLFKLPYDILKGLNYIHENNIIHLDISCRNIFYDNNIYVIGDFGNCKKTTKNVADIQEGYKISSFLSISMGNKAGIGTV